MAEVAETDLFSLDATPAPLFAPAPATAGLDETTQAPERPALDAAAGPDGKLDLEVALRELHERYAQRLLAFCVSMLHSREDAEDAVQTAFLNAFGSLQDGREPRQEISWLFRIARNVCLNRIRSAQRKPVQPLQDIEVASRSSVDDVVEQRLHSFALRTAIERLPVQQRTALVMRELQGASYGEIAEAMGASQGAVESLLFRARRQMAHSMRSASLGLGTSMAAA